MATDTQKAILNLCIELDSLSTQIYHHFSRVEKDEGLKERWRVLEADEADHVRFWRLLARSQEEGLVPEMFDDPVAALRNLESTRLKMHEHLDGMHALSDAQAMLAAACHIEVYFLDQNLLQLLKYVKTEPGERDAFQQYHDHLARFLDTVNTYSASAELRLIGETISRLWTDNRRLMDSAFLDPLTGLLNRRGFFEASIPLCNLAQRKCSTVAIFMIDIDHFKRINDTYGHKAGDDALRFIAKVIREGFRGSDVAARYGGDEFVVFLSEVHPDHLRSMAEKLRGVVESAKENAVPTTVSIGIAHTAVEKATHTETWLDSLIKRADENLYRSKETGRNRVEM